MKLIQNYVDLLLFISFVSALTVLGNPVETYLYGTQYITIILCFLPLTALLIFIYAPVYFKLQLTSGYEVRFYIDKQVIDKQCLHKKIISNLNFTLQYFELRFNSTVRMVLSLVHCFYLVFYMALVVYGPSLALNQGILAGKFFKTLIDCNQMICILLYVFQ